jgi:nitroimidazol reductase NimA-like FMN-containing flavoprotein (pyridoxamine 5'-phosphate oxidase superfamily)
MAHVYQPDGDLGALAGKILDRIHYMALGTADAAGRPWVSPVYFACDGYVDFYWVSSPDTTHSRNLAVRPEVSMVVFDSRVAIGQGQGVYVRAVAAEVPATETERAIEVFTRRSLADGGRPWTPVDVHAPARHRLYRARAEQHWVLDPRDRRTLVNPTQEHA